jgi:hypothetical protein
MSGGPRGKSSAGASIALTFAKNRGREGDDADLAGKLGAKPSTWRDNAPVNLSGAI